MKSIYLPVPQHTRCCQNYLCCSLISRAESHTPPFTVIINILYTKLPSEKGTWQDSAAVSASSQFLNFSFRNGRFQSPELWIFCSTSASLCRGWEVDWEQGWVSVVIVSIVCLWFPGREQNLMERTLASELVRPVFTSQLRPIRMYLGKSLKLSWDSI